MYKLPKVMAKKDHTVKLGRELLLKFREGEDIFKQIEMIIPSLITEGVIDDPKLSNKNNNKEG